ncbi:hypothetical protein [Bacteriovorax sp. Seq25_V]|uniref:hypothetical protein n=1 Tax=Bacteriovorax sp. Seq25_V TaxID=1201288 RepID=UPI00038A2970|nr:hypothetical protein [Bacteriovorax sp. Seq25_V]EQC45411.1 hypothetical protein M900_2119 [Bacteriovorax sp. Seq25_V]
MKLFLYLIFLSYTSVFAVNLGIHEGFGESQLTPEDIVFCRKKPQTLQESCLREMNRQNIVEINELEKQRSSNRHIVLTNQEIEKCKLSSEPVICESSLRYKKARKLAEEKAAKSKVDREVLAVLDARSYSQSKVLPKVERAVALDAKSTTGKDGSILTTATIVGPVVLTDEDRKKISDCTKRTGDFNLCQRIAKSEKRVELAKSAAQKKSRAPASQLMANEGSSLPIATVAAPAPEKINEKPQERKIEEAVKAEPFIVSVENPVMEVLPVKEERDVLNKEVICNKAYRYEVVKDVKKCVSKLDEDFAEAFKLERDIEFKIVDNTLDDHRKQYRAQCRKDYRMGYERDACYEEVRAKLREERKKLEEPHKVKYAIYESKLEKIEDEYEAKKKENLLAECGKKPFTHSGREGDSTNIQYNTCKRKANKKFKEANALAFNEKKAELTVSELEQAEVSQKCEKGAFNFLSGSYDKCIDRTIASLGQEKPAPLEASPEVLAVTQSSEATEEVKFNCSDSVNKEIKALLENDPDNILGRMFHVTSLKIAQKVIEENKNKRAIALTFEDHIAQNKNLYKSDKVSELLATYRKHGKILDAEFIDQNIKNKNPSYYKSRMTNENISAYLLADIYGNPTKSKFNEADAATAWLMGKVGENSPFKAKTNGTNLLDMSVLVYRHLNLVKGDREQSQARINELLSKEQESLNEKFGALKEAVENKFSSQCTEFFASNCWTKEDSFNDRIASSFMNLGEELQGKIDIGSDLTGSIGGKYKFNFLPKQFVK